MTKRILYRIAVVLCMACVTSHAAAQLLSAKTNALFWGNMTPNLGLELVTSKRTSFVGNAYYSLDNQPIDCNIRAVDVQFRYWFSNRPMARSFIGLGVQGVHYKTKFYGTKHFGDAAGPGLVYGYALPLTKHFNVEFSAGMSVMWFREKRGNVSKYNASGHRLMPMGLGISCSYIFK